ncbi:MAG: hypothetical protein JST85_11500 [Acidobacteria bacterium]|nr:hypothetical protein [Acidobacteriota bacterium]
MIVSPWSQLNEHEQWSLISKLVGLREPEVETDQQVEAAAERFDQLIIEYGLDGNVNRRATADNVLTARNFIVQAARFWPHIAEIKGFRRSYLELTVLSREAFLQALADADYVINREPFWTNHKFDSAREMTNYSMQPSLHFANDRANESEYGPSYFFVHWDKTSAWFRKSNWRIRFLPGARQIEQLYAAVHHRFGCACPRQVSEHLKRV